MYLFPLLSLLLLWFLGCPASLVSQHWSPVASDFDSSCPLQASREAIRIIERDIIHALAVAGIAEPSSESCPFSSSSLARDANRVLEGKKVRLTASAWRCSDCGKVFRNERYLEAHLWIQHAVKGGDAGKGRGGLMGVGEGEKKSDICFADFCGMVGCASTALQENGPEAADGYLFASSSGSRRNSGESVLLDSLRREVKWAPIGGVPTAWLYTSEGVSPPSFSRSMAISSSFLEADPPSEKTLEALLGASLPRWRVDSSESIEAHPSFLPLPSTPIDFFQRGCARIFELCFSGSEEGGESTERENVGISDEALSTDAASSRERSAQSNQRVAQGGVVDLKPPVESEKMGSEGANARAVASTAVQAEWGVLRSAASARLDKDKRDDSPRQEEVPAYSAFRKSGKTRAAEQEAHSGDDLKAGSSRNRRVGNDLKTRKEVTQRLIRDFCESAVQVQLSPDAISSLSLPSSPRGAPAGAAAAVVDGSSQHQLTSIPRGRVRSHPPAWRGGTAGAGSSGNGDGGGTLYTAFVALGLLLLAMASLAACVLCTESREQAALMRDFRHLEAEGRRKVPHKWGGSVAPRQQTKSLMEPSGGDRMGGKQKVEGEEEEERGRNMAYLGRYGHGTASNSLDGGAAASLRKRAQQGGLPADGIGRNPSSEWQLPPSTISYPKKNDFGNNGGKDDEDDEGGVSEDYSSLPSLGVDASHQASLRSGPSQARGSISTAASKGHRRAHLGLLEKLHSLEGSS